MITDEVRGGGIQYTVYFLLQKVFEGEFIHVIAFAENFYFTTYSSLVALGIQFSVLNFQI